MPALSRTIMSAVTTLGGANVLTRLLSFVSVLLITRGLSLEGYGSFQLALATVAPVALLTAWGLESVVLADISRAVGDAALGRAKRLMMSFTRNKIALSFLVVGAAWLFRPLLVAAFGAFLNDYFLALSVWVIVSEALAAVTIILHAHTRFSAMAGMTVAEPIFRFAAVCALWQFQAFTPITVLGAYIVGKLGSAVIAVPAVTRVLARYRTVVAEPAQTYWAMVRGYGKWGSISQAVLPQMDGVFRPWVMNILLGTQAVALVSVSTTVFSALTSILPVQKILMPIIARESADRRKAELLAQKASKYSLLIYLVVGVAAALAVEPFMRVFFPYYQESVLLILLTLLRLPFIALGPSHDALFYTYHLQKGLAGVTVLKVISDVTLLPLSVMAFGITGMYWERLLNVAVSAALRERYLRRRIHMAAVSLRNLAAFDGMDLMLLRMIRSRLPFARPRVAG